MPTDLVAFYRRREREIRRELEERKASQEGEEDASVHLSLQPDSCTLED